MPLLNAPQHRTGTCVPARGTIKRLPVATVDHNIFWLDGIHIPLAYVNNQFTDDYIKREWRIRMRNNVAPSLIQLKEDNALVSLPDTSVSLSTEDLHPSGASLFIENDVTIEGVFKLTQAHSKEAMLLTRGINTLHFLNISSGSLLLNDDVVLAPWENWHHIIYIQSNGNLSTYHNGVLKDTRAFSAFVAAFGFSNYLKGMEIGFSRMAAGAAADPNTLWENAQAYLARFGESF